MKNLIAALSVLLTSYSALAMHAYGNDNCIAKTLQGATLEIDLANGRPANPHQIIDREQSNNDEFQAVEFKGTNLGNEEEESNSPVLSLQSKGDTNLVSEKVSDGCFEGYQQTSTRAATVLAVTQKISDKYGIKTGQTLQFVCYEYYTAPTGKDCGR